MINRSLDITSVFKQLYPCLGHRKKAVLQTLTGYLQHHQRVLEYYMVFISFLHIAFKMKLFFIHIVSYYTYSPINSKVFVFFIWPPSGILLIVQFSHLTSDQVIMCFTAETRPQVKSQPNKAVCSTCMTENQQQTEETERNIVSGGVCGS